MTILRSLRSAAAPLLVVLAMVPAAARAQAPSREDDAAVYRAAIHEFPTRIIRSTTARPVEFESLRAVTTRLAERVAALPDVDASTARAFLIRMRREEPVPDLGDTTLVWIDEAGWRDLLRARDGMATLADRHPGSAGILVLSAIGYSDDGTQALVYVSHFCPLCGSGRVILLEREGGAWTVTESVDDWNS